MVISEELRQLRDEAEAALAPHFANVDRISAVCTEKVLESFRAHRVSESHFAPTTGYGYDDKGRDTLDEIYADVLGTEAAFVRHSITSGTHALTIGLFGLLRPGDTLLILGDEENGMIVTKPDVLNNLAAKILDQIGNEK